MQQEISNLIPGIMNVSEEAVLGILSPVMLAIGKAGAAAYINLMTLRTTAWIIETQISKAAVLGILSPIMLAIAKAGAAAYLNLMTLTTTSWIIETQILKAGNHHQDIEPKEEKRMPPKGTSVDIVSNGMKGTTTVSMTIYLICSRINIKWYVHLLVSKYPLSLSNSWH